MRMGIKRFLPYINDILLGIGLNNHLQTNVVLLMIDNIVLERKYRQSDSVSWS